MRRQHHGCARVGDRGHHRGHELVPGQRIQHRHRFVQHEQVRTPGQRQCQRELCPLPAGQLAGLTPQRDAQLAQPGFGVVLVEAPVQVAGRVQHVGGGQVRVQRRAMAQKWAVRCDGQSREDEDSDEVPGTS